MRKDQMLRSERSDGIGQLWSPRINTYCFNDLVGSLVIGTHVTTQDSQSYCRHALQKRNTYCQLVMGNEGESIMMFGRCLPSCLHIGISVTRQSHLTSSCVPDHHKSRRQPLKDVVYAITDVTFGGFTGNGSRCRPTRLPRASSWRRAQAPDSMSDDGEGWNVFNPAVVSSSLGTIVGQ